MIIPVFFRLETQILLDCRKCLFFKCHTKLSVEWQKNCPRRSVGWKVDFGCLITTRWISSEPTSRGLLWTRSGDIQQLKHRKPGTIEDRSHGDHHPKVGSPCVNTAWIQAQKRPPTWWQDITKKFLLIAPLRHFQENKKRRAPQVSHNSTVKTHTCVNWRRPDIFGTPTVGGH